LLQFRKALSYVPEYPDAVAGIEKVNKYYKKRYDEASDHYIKGARARGEQLVVQSKYHNGIASEKDPSMREARKRETEAARQLGRERYERARKMEEERSFAAALGEYEAVLAVVPDLEGLKERIAVAEKEVETVKLRRQAEMAMRTNDFDEAEELLNKAYDLTQAQKADLSGLLLVNRQRRYEDRYRKAKDLELEYQFEAALEAYAAINKVWPAGFLDVKARINTLSEAIKLAGDSMAEGQKLEKAGDLKKAIELYEEALTVYPGYRGLDQRVKGLKAKIQN
jgi:tetratricopeptide (TPR) repeat protein